MKKTFLFLTALFFTFTAGHLFADDLPVQSSDLETGSKYFLQNQMDRAIPFLKTASYINGESEAFVFLALAYYEKGNLDDALLVCEDGLKKSLDCKDKLSFIAGNISFAKGDTLTAENWYSLALKENESYSAALLNRANTRLSLEKYTAAKNDYEAYLAIETESEQKDTILQIIEKINEILLEEEAALRAQQAMEEEAWLREEEEKLSAMKDAQSDDEHRNLTDEEKWLLEEEEKIAAMKEEVLPENEDKELTDEEKWLLEEEEKIAAMKEAEKALQKESPRWADDAWLKAEDEKISSIKEVKTDNGKASWELIENIASSPSEDKPGEEVWHSRIDTPDKITTESNNNDFVEK